MLLREEVSLQTVGHYLRHAYTTAMECVQRGFLLTL